MGTIKQINIKNQTFIVTMILLNLKILIQDY